MSPASKKPTVIEEVKVWITPLLISIIGTFLWSTMTEMRADVKLLLEQKAESNVKIQNLEYRVQMLETKMWEYHGKSNNTSHYPEKDNIPFVLLKHEIYAPEARREPPKITAL
jgi:Zn-dependent peptidase ImmA (M78 family)